VIVASEALRHIRKNERVKVIMIINDISKVMVGYNKDWKSPLQLLNDTVESTIIDFVFGSTQPASEPTQWDLVPNKLLQDSLNGISEDICWGPPSS
jgi:hypothetical protein